MDPFALKWYWQPCLDSWTLLLPTNPCYTLFGSSNTFSFLRIIFLVWLPLKLDSRQSRLWMTLNGALFILRAVGRKCACLVLLLLLLFLERERDLHVAWFTEVGPMSQPNKISASVSSTRSSARSPSLPACLPASPIHSPTLSLTERLPHTLSRTLTPSVVPSHSFRASRSLIHNLLLFTSLIHSSTPSPPSCLHTAFPPPCILRSNVTNVTSSYGPVLALQYLSSESNCVILIAQKRFTSNA